MQTSAWEFYAVENYVKENKIEYSLLFLVKSSESQKSAI